MYQFIWGILERVQWKIKPYFTCFQTVDYDSPVGHEINFVGHDQHFRKKKQEIYSDKEIRKKYIDNVPH